MTSFKAAVRCCIIKYVVLLLYLHCLVIITVFLIVYFACCNAQ